MSEFKTEWKGECLHMGRWNVGRVFYTPFTSKDDPNKYQASCFLPGIKSDLGRYDDIKDAGARLERAVNHWIKEAAK